uniref:Hook domaincontaining protein putative n=1 Tax=Albugo laibachii Nc14 TaxID=890382 RepID=F0WPD8_9STRA|nr:hook domaincontaining protein putative [Albugo laibachii Nc14]|eukprot:CCA23185.1 hook domaincontaining protein putative [Albugo laibachii Nc14]
MNLDAQQSLLSWIQSFVKTIQSSSNLSQSHYDVQSLADLCNGIFLSYLMHKIDPSYIQLDTIKLDTNYFSHLHNITTLVSAIESYYREELTQICDSSNFIDISKIVKETNEAEICKLIELLLGCAVQCPRKSDYIHPIMQMDATAQQNLMLLIENLMHRFQMISPPPHDHRSADTKASFSYSVQDEVIVEDLQRLLQINIEKVSILEMRILDMEREKQELSERIENVMKEKNGIDEKYNRLHEEKQNLVLERQSTLTRDNKKIQQLVESEVHAIVMELEANKEELQRTKEEAHERILLLENEMRRQADELDISRTKLGQLSKLETSLPKYKKKLEEMNTLKNELRELETHNAQYLEKVLDLESTIKTMPTLKALVEKYKNQVVELETRNVEATSNIQIRDQKIRRLQEELDSTLGGKEFLENQLEELRAQVSNLVQQGNDGENSDFTGGHQSAFDTLLGSSSISSLKERLARMERENAELKSGSPNAAQIHLESELELAIKAKDSLQMNMMQLKKKNQHLEEELEAALKQVGLPKAFDTVSQLPFIPHNEEKSASASSGLTESASLAARNTSIGVEQSSRMTTTMLEEYEDKLSRMQSDVEEVDSMRATVQELTNRLKDKESSINELNEQRAKLESYTRKTLHAVQTKYMVTVSSHRNQIGEKQEKIEFLEKRLKEMRASYSREQALMMSSFYEIGMEMQRRTMMPQASPQHGNAAFQPTSWLSSRRAEERTKRRNL